MNRDALLAKFETAGISPAAYSIDGVPRNETYVLSQEKSGWIVYYGHPRLRRRRLGQHAGTNRCVGSFIDEDE